MRIYRTFKNYALTMPDCFGSKTAVTASARKTAAQDVFAETKEIELAKTTLGHKRVSSTQYYINDNGKGREKGSKKKGTSIATPKNKGKATA